MVRRSCSQRLGVLPDHAERLYTHHVPSGLSERAAGTIGDGSPGASAFHEFWADDVSLLDTKISIPTRIHGPRQITDLYLLALAVRHRGQFVTFDASVTMNAIKGAEEKRLLIL